jgi:hypothetical protein
VRVAGLGQDRRRAHGGQAGDVRQPAQPELVQHRHHVGLCGSQLGADALQVTQLVGDPAEQAAAGGDDHALGIGQRGEDPAADRAVRLLAAPAGDRAADQVSALT